ncbi:hypothetical protein FACHB389_35315 [Nostoc calcicola FACHB-389]|nr:hypothetical protein FACHB389_35315 [Nostoc calcicola FACHB-389]
MTEKIIHYVPGNWGGKGILVAMCGEKVIYTHASSQFTNCHECKVLWKQTLTLITTDRLDYE